MTVGGCDGGGSGGGGVRFDVVMRLMVAKGLAWLGAAAMENEAKGLEEEELAEEEEATRETAANGLEEEDDDDEEDDEDGTIAGAGAVVDVVGAAVGWDEFFLIMETILRF